MLQIKVEKLNKAFIQLTVYFSKLLFSLSIKIKKLLGVVGFSLLGTVEFFETSSELESLEELEVVDVLRR